MRRCGGVWRISRLFRPRSPLRARSQSEPDHNRAMSWAWCAVLSAFFGALVAIFGKIGVRGVDSNLAVAVRTVIIVFFAWGIVLAQGNIAELRQISRHSLLFLFLSAIATGLSWLFYYKALQL